MRGFPKYLNSKQDYYNIIRDDLDREKVHEALNLLLATAKRKEPVWPKGYDPVKAMEDPNADPVEPVGWEEVDDPNGKIVRLGFTIEDVKTLMDIVLAVRPFEDKLKDLEGLVEKQAFGEAAEMRGALAAGMPALLSEQLSKRFGSRGSLKKAITAEDKNTALQIIHDAEKQVESVILTVTGGK